MVNGPTHSAGRPGSALLLLGAIFATALIVRVPLGPAPVGQPVAATIAAKTLDIWPALPAAVMNRPAIDAPTVMRARIGLTAPAPPIEPIRVASVASLIESAGPGAVPQRSPLSEPPIFVAEPALALASTPHTHFAGLAAAVTPVSFVEQSSSNPFGAVGTAFVKTGAALTLAFKKTGQGILAPF